MCAPPRSSSSVRLAAIVGKPGCRDAAAVEEALA
jgi:hypothetical protein